MAHENRMAPPVTPIDAGRSYLDWGASTGGIAVSCALAIVLLQFGAGVGLSLGEPLLEDGSASWNVIVAGLWTVVVAAASGSAGGYIAGRMRARHGDAAASEVEFRDGTHGLVVWAGSTLIVAVLMALLAALAAVGAAASPAAPDVMTDSTLVRLTQSNAIIMAFAIGAGAALGAGAAWFAAIMGGEHRDNGLSVHTLVPGPFRRKSVR